MSIGTLWVIGSVVIFSVCGLGVVLCREIMLEEVQNRMPAGTGIKYPRLSWRYPEIVRLHGQYYPNSRIRALNRFLSYVAAFVMGSLVIGLFGMVMLKSALK
jgi:hypothetical protein